jgi:hypothetical protein
MGGTSVTFNPAARGAGGGVQIFGSIDGPNISCYAQQQHDGDEANAAAAAAWELDVEGDVRQQKLGRR